METRPSSRGRGLTQLSRRGRKPANKCYGGGGGDKRCVRETQFLSILSDASSPGVEHGFKSGAETADRVAEYQTDWWVKSVYATHTTNCCSSAAWRVSFIFRLCVVYPVVPLCSESYSVYM